MILVFINAVNARMWSKLGQRSTFGITMLELGASLDNLVVLTADLSTTSGLDRFRASYPEKFINIGIAEQNLVGIAAGLAKEGKIVFATTFANFAAMRSYEQVRLNMGYMQLPVILVGLGSGFAMGMFGNTHYGMEDVALMRAVPNLCILSPADCTEVVQVTTAAARCGRPIYIRLTGTPGNPMIYRDDYPFTIGKSISLRTGTGISIIATGSMVHHSLKAAEILETRGFSVSVINMHTIKPLDTGVVDAACSCSSALVTVEEHSIIGGLGGAVAEYLSDRMNKPRHLIIGIPDSFPPAGDYSYLIEQAGLTGLQIAEKILNRLYGES